MLKYLTGVAALALAASAASADPGGGKGGGDHGGGKPHAAQAGGGNGNANGGDKAQGKGGGKPQAAQGGGGKSAAQRGPERAAKTDRGPNKPAMAQQRGREESGADRTPRGQAYASPRNAVGDGGRRNDDLANWRWADSVPQRTRRLIAGCPPGLAKKDNGCLPPGLARRAAAPVFYDSPNWWNFDDRWHDSAGWNGGETRYYDGYLVRYGDRGIDSWLPLLGGALSPGNLWPSQYETQGLPPYYQDYYGVGEPDGYRYYDDTLYRVDPQSQAITAISALLTGNTFQVGQQMPQGYDVYNVPSSYRDRYRDGPDADYRYSDGSIYQVDPKTRLVQAVIGLLT